MHGLDQMVLREFLLCKKIAYIAGPIHFLLSIPFYILLAIAYGIRLNWVTIVISMNIICNILFFYLIFKKYNTRKTMKLMLDIPELTNWSIITIGPNALVIMGLGAL